MTVSPSARLYYVPWRMLLNMTDGYLLRRRSHIRTIHTKQLCPYRNLLCPCQASKYSHIHATAHSKTSDKRVSAAMFSATSAFPSQCYSLCLNSLLPLETIKGWAHNSSLGLGGSSSCELLKTAREKRADTCSRQVMFAAYVWVTTILMHWLIELFLRRLLLT